MELRKSEWEESYRNKNNYVFYPHEEIIRFISKYIRKRVGIKEIIKINDMKKGVDLGCGIGRHVIYLDDMGLEAYGIDLSEEAINTAREWCKSLGKESICNNLVIGTITQMPFKEHTFDFVISHGVLDSIEFYLAKQAIKEVHRVLVKDGLFYLDLISGDDHIHPREYCGEEVIQGDFEHGTIQSYFNWSKIKELIQGLFDVKEAILIKRECVCNNKEENSRYHLILHKC